MLTIGVNPSKDHGSHKAMAWGLLLVCSFSMFVKLTGLFGESRAAVSQACLFGAFLVGMVLPRLNSSWRDQVAKQLQPIKAAGKRGAESPHLASTQEEAASETEEEASETTETSSETKSSPNSEIQGRSLKAQVEPISVETVQHMLDSTSGIDAGDLARGIVACCKSGNLGLAEKWLGHLLSLAPTALKVVSAAHVHKISEAGIRAGGARKVAGWLGQLHAAGIQANSRTLLSALDSLVAINEVAQAEQFLSQMEAANAQLDSACYELLFEHCIPLESTENVARATMWLQRIGRRGPAQLAKGFAAIIRARGSPLIGLERTAEEAIAAEINRAQQAEFWMNRAIAAGVTQSTQCYNAVIEACARIDIAKAEVWLQHMENAAKAAMEKQSSGDACGDSSTHFGPDADSFSTIMDAYAQRGDTEKAKAYFARMKALPGNFE